MPVAVGRGLYGTANMVHVEEWDTRLVLRFFIDPVANQLGVTPTSAVMLTRKPKSMIDAFLKALSSLAPGPTIEFEGENFFGRACSFKDTDEYSWAMQFQGTGGTGFLIHLRKAEMIEILGLLSKLPDHDFLTD